MELDFRGCVTREDVEKVFDEKIKDLEQEAIDTKDLKELFFNDIEKKEGGLES